MFAFEPSKSNYGYLLRHLRYNSIENIDAYQVVVGDVNREGVPFFEHVVGSSPLSGLIPRTKRASDKFIESPRTQISLDDFCVEHDLAPDVMKMDVEGAEMLVLRGAKKTLARYRPLLYLSVHPSQLAALGQSVEELGDFLRELGYEARGSDGKPANELRSGEYVCVATPGGKAPGAAQAPEASKEAHVEPQRAH